MKKLLSPANLPFAAFGGGLLTMLLRLWLLAIGEDDRGLLATGSFPDAASWIVVGLMMALLGYGALQLQGKEKYRINFPASAGAAFGIALAAVGILITSVTDWFGARDIIGTISSVLGLLAGIALGFLAFFRFRGIRPNLLLHGVVCIYLMLHLVSHYRLWSSYPQLQDYGFELLAIVFIMLACYQRAAFDAGRGSRSSYTFFSLAALFFCIAALPGCDSKAFFIGCAVWMAATPCKLVFTTEKKEE